MCVFFKLSKNVSYWSGINKCGLAVGLGFAVETGLPKFVRPRPIIVITSPAFQILTINITQLCFYNNF